MKRVLAILIVLLLLVVALVASACTVKGASDAGLAASWKVSVVAGYVNPDLATFDPIVGVNDVTSHLNIDQATFTFKGAGIRITGEPERVLIVHSTEPPDYWVCAGPCQVGQNREGWFAAYFNAPPRETITKGVPFGTDAKIALWSHAPTSLIAYDPSGGVPVPFILPQAITGTLTISGSSGSGGQGNQN